MLAVCAVLLVLCAGVHGEIVPKVVEKDISRTSTKRFLRQSADGTDPFTLDVNWNDVADTIIALAKREILANGKGELPLPDIKEDYSLNLGFTRIGLKVKATGGRVSDISSFKRSAEVSLVKEHKESLGVLVPLRLDDLKVTYDDYKVSFLGIKASGVLQGTVDTSTFRFTIFGQHVGEGCEAALVKVEVIDLGELKVKITGLGGLNRFASYVLGLYLERKKGGIEMKLENLLLEELSRLLQVFKCDELHTLFALG